jgi:hypothetical protein
MPSCYFAWNRIFLGITLVYNTQAVNYTYVLIFITIIIIIEHHDHAVPKIKAGVGSVTPKTSSSYI